MAIIISATGPSATIVVRMCPQKAICSYATSALICFIIKIITLTIICIVYSYMLQDQELLDMEVPGMACRPVTSGQLQPAASGAGPGAGEGPGPEERLDMQMKRP